jgi:glucose-1-phosphate cytidylyltransferase
MKVVLFCGGLGMRLRDYSDKIPKPMVEIGYRPILWHVMKYYAAWGYKDFILCLGYKADVIKRYFVEYQEFLSNDFVLRGSDSSVKLLHQDIHEWSITFVDTGYASSIGERLLKVRRHLAGEEMFLANYSDNLTDFHLPTLVSRVRESDAIAAFLAVKPPHSFHLADFEEDGTVTRIQDTRAAAMWINGGYFCLRQEIFDHLHEGEELVIEGFERLLRRRKLLALPYEGFWQNMDTFKDRSMLNDMLERGEAPWQIWQVEP